MADVTIGLAGATGALGQEILEVLDQAPWRPDQVIPLASASTTTAFVDYGGEQVAVDDLDVQSMLDVHALILAVPSEVAREAGERAIAAGTPVIDCSGAFESAPAIIPWVNPQVLQGLGAEIVVRIPDPTSTLLASLIGPLQRAGVQGEIDATVLVPASTRGRGGVEELSQQVIALFNQGTPPRKVFESGLAFDLLPALGPTGDEGWTAEERQAVREVRAITGLRTPFTATLVGVPLFSGISATVMIRTPQRVDPNLVARVLSDGGVVTPELAGARHLPRPRRVEGKPLVHMGRLRADPEGRGIHLWVAMDNLRTSAAVATAACGALLKMLGDLGDDDAPR